MVRKLPWYILYQGNKKFLKLFLFITIVVQSHVIFADAEIKVVNENKIVYCNFDRIVSSPSGTDFIIWKSDDFDPNNSINYSISKSFLLMRTEGNISNFSTIISPVRIAPISFGNSGKNIYIKLYSDKIVHFNIEKSEFNVNKMDPDNSVFRISSTGYINENRFNDDFENIKTKYSLKNNFTRSYFVFGSKKAYLLGFDNSNALSIYSQMGEVDSKKYVDGATVKGVRFYEEGGVLKIGYLGVGRDLYKDASREALSSLYSFPIVDSGSGSIIGYFNESQASFFDVQRKTRSSILNVHANDDEYLVDVATIGYRYSLLKSSLNGDIFVEDSTGNKYHICNKNTSLERIGVDGLRGFYAQNWSIKKNNVEVFGRSVISKDDSKGLLLYFHGGPGYSTFSDGIESFSQMTHRVVGSHDFISIDYASSPGWGIEKTKSLARTGAREIKAEMKALSGWIRNKKYQRIFVVSQSFGAIPALFLKENLQNPNVEFHFIAPLLKIRPAEAFTAESGNSIRLVNQLAFENAMYGSNKILIDRDLQRIKSRIGVCKKCQFYFGSEDKISKISDISPLIVNSDQILVVRSGHDFVYAKSDVWNKLGKLR